MKSIRMLAALLAMALITVSCSGGDAVDVDKQWARQSPKMATAGAVYMDLTSTDANRLIGAVVDESIAAKVEVHETTMKDDGSGEMMMQEVGRIDLPAGETVSLEPGGLHIMLLDLASELEIGQQFELTLQFAETDAQVITVEVREDAP